ncbi:unnamed protein product [Protopolystoma xenopodis]|uniref:Uncharacterized protein n=1 Tax=Protopolystoma xenopodis TaxID=117903 RepID=A0A448WR83_9PLAT|nr:unnamed protein product [Protopolystoma xenopodis]
MVAGGIPINPTIGVPRTLKVSTTVPASLGSTGHLNVSTTSYILSQHYQQQHAQQQQQQLARGGRFSSGSLTGLTSISSVSAPGPLDSEVGGVVGGMTSLHFPHHSAPESKQQQQQQRICLTVSPGGATGGVVDLVGTSSFPGGTGASGSGVTLIQQHSHQQPLMVIYLDSLKLFCYLKPLSHLLIG